MEKYYAVIDTNVIVSTMLKRDSIPGCIVQFCESGIIVPLYDDRIIMEYREVLSRKKFHFDKKIIDQFIDNIIAIGVKVDAETINIDMPDPNDRVFYEVVMEERKQEISYLITGNIKHFPHRAFIVTPREMLNIIIKDNLN